MPAPVMDTSSEVPIGPNAPVTGARAGAADTTLRRLRPAVTCTALIGSTTDYPRQQTRPTGSPRHYLPFVCSRLKVSMKFKMPS
jgi:hypothetical protein